MFQNVPTIQSWKFPSGFSILNDFCDRFLGKIPAEPSHLLTNLYLKKINKALECEGLLPVKALSVEKVAVNEK